MPRRFTTSNQYMRFSVGANTAFAFGDATWVGLMKKEGGDGNYHSLFTTTNSGGTVQGSIELDNANHVEFYTGASHFTSVLTVTVSDGWCIIVVAKTTGFSGQVTCSKCVLSTGVWTHETNGSFANWAAPGAGGFFEVGRWETVDISDTSWGGQALYPYVMTNAQREASLNASWQQWLGLGPQWMAIWDASSTSDKTPDLVGSGHEVSSTTTLSTLGLPQFGYGAPIGGLVVSSGSPPPADPDIGGFFFAA